MRKISLFSLLFVLVAAMSFNACKKDKFTDEDALKLLAEQERAADSVKRAQESAIIINENMVADSALVHDDWLRNEVYFTVQVINATNNTINKDGGVNVATGATVSLSHANGYETKTVASTGMAYFDGLLPGTYDVTVELSGFTTVHFKATANPNDGAGDHNVGAYYSVQVPIFNLTEKLATVSGTVAYEKDLTNNDVELVDGVNIFAVADVANFNSGTIDGVTQITYPDLNQNTTITTGAYSFDLVSDPAQKIVYNLFIDDFETTQSAYLSEYQGYAFNDQKTDLAVSFIGSSASTIPALEGRGTWKADGWDFTPLYIEVSEPNWTLANSGATEATFDPAIVNPGTDLQSVNVTLNGEGYTADDDNQIKGLLVKEGVAKGSGEAKIDLNFDSKGRLWKVDNIVNDVSKPFASDPIIDLKFEQTPVYLRFKNTYNSGNPASDLRSPCDISSFSFDLPVDNPAEQSFVLVSSQDDEFTTTEDNGMQTGQFLTKNVTVTLDGADVPVSSDDDLIENPKNCFITWEAHLDYKGNANGGYAIKSIKWGTLVPAIAGANNVADVIVAPAATTIVATADALLSTGSISVQNVKTRGSNYPSYPTWTSKNLPEGAEFGTTTGFTAEDDDYFIVEMTDEINTAWGKAFKDENDGILYVEVTDGDQGFSASKAITTIIHIGKKQVAVEDDELGIYWGDIKNKELIFYPYDIATLNSAPYLATVDADAAVALAEADVALANANDAFDDATQDVEDAQAAKDALDATDPNYDTDLAAADAVLVAAQAVLTDAVTAQADAVTAQADAQTAADDAHKAAVDATMPAIEKEGDGHTIGLGYSSATASVIDITTGVAVPGLTATCLVNKNSSVIEDIKIVWDGTSTIPVGNQYFKGKDATSPMQKVLVPIKQGGTTIKNFYLGIGEVK